MKTYVPCMYYLSGAQLVSCNGNGGKCLYGTDKAGLSRVYRLYACLFREQFMNSGSSICGLIVALGFGCEEDFGKQQ